MDIKLEFLRTNFSINIIPDIKKEAIELMASFF